MTARPAAGYDSFYAIVLASTTLDNLNLDTRFSALGALKHSYRVTRFYGGD